METARLRRGATDEELVEEHEAAAEVVLLIEGRE